MWTSTPTLSEPSENGMFKESILKYVHKHCHVIVSHYDFKFRKNKHSQEYDITCEVNIFVYCV